MPAVSRSICPQREGTVRTSGTAAKEADSFMCVVKQWFVFILSLRCESEFPCRHLTRERAPQLAHESRFFWDRLGEGIRCGTAFGSAENPVQCAPEGNRGRRRRQRRHDIAPGMG